MAGERLIIERLTAVDETIAADLDRLFDEGVEWDAEQGAAFLQHPDCLLLAARWDGRICGFATAYRLQRFDRRQAEAQLYEIAVDEVFQRRGIGSALIMEARRWAGEVGAAETWVLTETDNDAARGLYAATGGVEDASRFVMFTYQ